MTINMIYVLGMGGWRLDPARGALVIIRRVQALSVRVVGVFDPNDFDAMTKAAKALPKDGTNVYGGDSCGGNRFAWLQSQAPEVRWRYAFLIQCSSYCNGGCPPICETVQQVDAFYAPFLTWPLPGLGNYKPQLKQMPPKVTYPGSYVGNHGKTKINYLAQKTNVHPGDDLAGTQAIIVSRIKALS